MKATAVAHPIQGLLKYHGFRDPARNVPAHDSISVCTAPSRTTTTVEFGHDRDSVTVDGEPIDEEGAGRAREVLDLVREQSGIDREGAVRAVESALREWAGAVDGEWTDAELDRAREIADRKYGSDAWNRERTDPLSGRS